MQRFRRLVNRLAPAWVFMWFVVSANLLAVCCVDDVEAAPPAVHADHAHVHDPDHAGQTPGEHACSLTLAEPGFPHAPPPAAAQTDADEPEAVAAVAAFLPPSVRAFSRTQAVWHGPPPDGRITYLETRRLRI